jgi:hypothetical protein
MLSLLVQYDLVHLPFLYLLSEQLELYLENVVDN